LRFSFVEGLINFIYKTADAKYVGRIWYQLSGWIMDGLSMWTVEILFGHVERNSSISCIFNPADAR
jgi:hypothetical protein